MNNTKQINYFHNFIYSASNKSVAFTLVELIVVIVILAILSTIAFLSFLYQSSIARDSKRMSDISSIVKGLQIFSATSGRYPIPDSNINIYSGITLIGFQGNAGEGVLNTISLSSGGGKDPLDDTFYTYNTNFTKNKAQLVGFLENQLTQGFYNNIQDIDKAYAQSYIDRFPYEKGDTLGIILAQSGTTNTNFIPIQDQLVPGENFDTQSLAQNTGKITVINNTDPTNFPNVANTIFSGYIYGTGVTTAVLVPTENDLITGIYYSVGQNLNDHKSGSPTVTIVGKLATFSIAQTENNMGIGDQVDYGTDNKICYISKKLSSTKWDCISATGDIPVQVTNVSVNSITHAFDSLNNAIVGASNSEHLNTTNLTTAGGGNGLVLNLPCYYDNGPDISNVIVNGYTTNPTNYINIYTPNDLINEVNSSQRHNGVWNDGKFRMSITSTWQSMITIAQSYTVTDGLQIDGVNTYQSYGIKALDPASPSVSNISIKNNIVKNFGSSAISGEPASDVEYAIGIEYPTNTIVYNNIVYDGIGVGIFAENYGFGTSIANNTVYGTRIGLMKNGMDIPAISINNIAINNGIDYSGEFIYSSNNISSDSTSPGTNSKTLTNPVFIDQTNKDFHLSPSDTTAINFGYDLSEYFKTDIDGELRPIGTWDIGADEK
ncbi:MAG: prepilin-type N-terminal cleavage/methylation domain-containing protein [Candidatus Gracilibacteria bacterium]|nr:prepilin-type N-terminal cleavage/methylation domain-containing protein [Candidatus Gracilibacteria bacterium]MDD2908859.1 prepilin-type N-terminal cleavage/methylation domain-containing protein [Candidatus Gracilibacteria bacterium]